VQGDEQQPLLDMMHCQLLNETICQVSVESTAVPGKKDIYVIVYNALLVQSWSSVMRLPLTGLDHYVYNVSHIAVVGDAGSAQEDAIKFQWPKPISRKKPVLSFT
jgi:hypothetical protein